MNIDKYIVNGWTLEWNRKWSMRFALDSFWTGDYPITRGCMFLTLLKWFQIEIAIVSCEKSNLLHPAYTVFRYTRRMFNSTWYLAILYCWLCMRTNGETFKNYTWCWYLAYWMILLSVKECELRLFMMADDFMGWEDHDELEEVKRQHQAKPVSRCSSTWKDQSRLRSNSVVNRLKKIFRIANEGTSEIIGRSINIIWGWHSRPAELFNQLSRSFPRSKSWLTVWN